MHGSDYRWDDLRVFLAILRKGSFSAAAQELGVEQSTVSRRIAALEKTIGGPLFDRRPTGPVPTGLAGRLSPLAEQVERAAHGVLDSAASAGAEVEGRVRLSVTDSFAVQLLIPQLLADLMRTHPGLQIDLCIDDRATNLSQREADLAIRHFRPTAGELAIRRLAHLRRSYLASETYARTHAGQPPEQLDWLVQHLPERDWNPDEAFVRTHVGVEPKLRTTGHLALIAAAQAGLGVAILSRSQRLLEPSLVELALPLPAPDGVDTWLVAPSSLRPVPRVAAVWQHLESHLPALLAQEPEA